MIDPHKHSSEGDIRPPGVSHEQLQAHYEALYEHAPCIYFGLSDDYIVNFVNTYGAKQLGWDKNAVVGRAIFEFVHEDDRATVKEKLGSAASGSLAGWEYRHVKSDGDVMWVEGATRWLLAPNGKKELLVISRDVTRRKAADKQVDEYQEQLRQLAFDTFLAEEQERRRVAIGLHDHVGHNLALARLKIDALRKSDPAIAMNPLTQEIRTLIDATIQSSRSLTFELSSPVLYELGFGPALRSLVREMSETSEARVFFEDDKEPIPLSFDDGVVLFRVVRELIRNIETHARARNARISVGRYQDELRIQIEDDGVGFELSNNNPSPTNRGFGLFSIREHLKMIGGGMEIDSVPGKGTRILIAAPLQTGEQ